MNAPPRPTPLSPVWPAIPEALRATSSWVCWAYELRGNRWTKPPLNARTGRYARTDDPDTWAPFEVARQAATRTDGVGLVLTADLVGIDLDHVIDETGEIESWANEVLARFKGVYVERSPGGDGLRLFCRGRVAHSGKGGPANRLEVYGAGSPRYLTTTGHKLGDGEVIEAQAALDWLHDKYMKAPEPRATRSADPRSPFRHVNDAALATLAAWVPVLFPDAKPVGSSWRVSSATLGRDLEEDLSFHPDGIKDWGVHDQGDANGGARSPIDVVMEVKGLDATAAARWLAQRLQVPFEARQSTLPAHVAGATDPWPTLDPLPELHDEAPAAFPFDALGPLLGPAAREIADAVQAPDSLAAGSVLAAAAVAVQPLASVMLPHGQTAPASLFIVTSAESGDRKSATDSVAGYPIEEQRRIDARAHAAALAAYQSEKAARKRGEAVDEPPIARSLIVSKGTTEGLHFLLRTQPHLGLFSTEGAELIGGHSMQPEKKSAAIAWLLKAWGGETLDSMTRGDGLSVLLGRRVSLHVLLQPVILRSLMGDPLAQGQGWIARCLIAAPASLAGSRLWRDDALPALYRPEVTAYHARLKGLLAVPPTLMQDGDQSELEPRAIPLSAAARALWVEFYDECERRQQAGADLAGARAWASKAAEQAGRIACIRAVVANRHAAEISDDDMMGGIEAAAFYLGEHVRLMGQSQEHQQAVRLETLLAFMRERRPFVEHADILQRTPRALRQLKAEGLAPLLDELAQRGYVRRRGDRWEIRP